MPFLGALFNTIVGVKKTYALNTNIDTLKNEVNNIDIFEGLDTYETLVAKNNLILAEFLNKSEDADLENKIYLWELTKTKMVENIEKVENELNSKAATKLDIAKLAIALEQIGGELDNEFLKIQKEINSKTFSLNRATDMCEELYQTTFEIYKDEVSNFLYSKTEEMNELQQNTKLLLDVNAQVESMRTNTESLLNVNEVVFLNDLKKNISVSKNDVIKSINYEIKNNKNKIMQEIEETFVDSKEQIINLNDIAKSKLDEAINEYQKLRKFSSDENENIKKEINQNKIELNETLKESSNKISNLKDYIDSNSNDLKKTIEHTNTNLYSTTRDIKDNLKDLHNEIETSKKSYHNEIQSVYNELNNSTSAIINNFNSYQNENSKTLNIMENNTKKNIELLQKEVNVSLGYIKYELKEFENKTDNYLKEMEKNSEKSIKSLQDELTESIDNIGNDFQEYKISNSDNINNIRDSLTLKINKYIKYSIFALVPLYLMLISILVLMFKK